MNLTQDIIDKYVEKIKNGDISLGDALLEIYENSTKKSKANFNFILLRGIAEYLIDQVRALKNHTHNWQVSNTSHHYAFDSDLERITPMQIIKSETTAVCLECKKFKTIEVEPME